jgi:uncharacterized DUF497 family protein
MAWVHDPFFPAESFLIRITIRIIIRINITWHETKRQQNIRDHKLDFRDAKRVFAGPTITFEDERFDYDEWRFITVGLLDGCVVVLSHTQRGNAIRMISMRKGTKREEIRFFRNLRS